MTGLLKPIWIGLASLYVVMTMWFLGASLLRNLRRLEAADGFADIPADRRLEILKRARRFLTIGGVMLGILGAVAWSTGPIAWVILALGAVLVGTGVLLTAEA